MDERFKELNDLMVFREFADAKNCPLRFVLNTVDHPKPPQPDITCQLESGSVLAFELTTTDDEHATKQSNVADKLTVWLNETYNQAIVANQIQPDRLLGHSVLVTLDSQSSLSRRQKCLTRVVDLIDELGPGHHLICGEAPIESISCWQNNSRCDNIPHIVVGSACTDGQHTMTRVVSKIAKSSEYKSENRIHLLAWSSINVPQEFLLKDLILALPSIESLGNFDRIWIFNRSTQSIAFDSATLFPVK